MRAALPLLVACGAAEPVPESPPVEPTTTCAIDADNPLIATCTVRFSEPAPVEIRFVSDRGRAAHFRSETPSTLHTLTAWGLGADRTWAWSHDDRSGTLKTGSLPDQLAGLTTEQSGQITGFDAVLRVLQCASNWFVMFNEGGEIVWYTPAEVYANPTNGYEWSQAERSVFSLAPHRLLQTHVSGEVLLELDEATHFPGKNLHHDITRWGPYTYVIFDEPYGGLRADGILVFRGTELVGTFRLSDTYTPPDTGTGDWAHANGINANEEGLIALSLRNFDMVLGIDGDPDSPTFLDILWTAGGSAQALGTPNFNPAIGPEEGWAGQHNPHVDGDRLTLFDNFGDGVVSRAARFHLDPTTGQAVHERSWYLDELCQIQSGAVPFDGGILASCASSGKVSAFAEASTEPSFQLEARCPPNGFVTAITRGIPVRIE